MQSNKLMTAFLMSVVSFAVLSCMTSHRPAADDDKYTVDDDASPDDDDNDDASPVDADDDDDLAWSQTQGEFPALVSLWGASHNDVFAVGSDWAANTAAVLHFDGTSWSQMFGAEGQFGLWSVSGTSPTNVFAVGEGNETVILHYDGETWSVMPAPVDLGFYLRGVWAGSASNGYAAGFDAKLDGVVGHFDGGDWSVVDGVFPDSLETVWGTSPSNVFVSGNGTMHFDGTTWAPAPGLIDNAGISSFWGASSSDVYAVGGLNSNGVILHFDGSSWSLIYNETSAASSFGVWGASQADVFAVGGYENAEHACHDAILHYDGSTWSVMDNGTYPFMLFSVRGSAPADVFAVGYDYSSGAGVILHYGAPD